jgi:hypothetical protein
MSKGLTKNWVELQEQLTWLAEGTVIGSITVDQYIKQVRDLLDNYEFMVVQRGS